MSELAKSMPRKLHVQDFAPNLLKQYNARTVLAENIIKQIAAGLDVAGVLALTWIARIFFDPLLAQDASYLAASDKTESFSRTFIEKISQAFDWDLSKRSVKQPNH